jgi:hypothetical protein
MNISNSLFKDAEGKVQIIQWPNLPLTTYLVAVILGKIFDQGTIHSVVRVVGFGALFTWAWLEIFQGVNYFRRFLGLIVLVFAIYHQSHVS